MEFFVNSATFYGKAEKVLSSAKLYINVFEIKKNKSFIEKLNKIDPVLEPLGTPETIL